MTKRILASVEFANLTHRDHPIDAYDRAYSASNGALATLEYPVSTSGYRLKLAYDYQGGQLKRVRHANGTTVFWEAVSTDAWGHLQNESFGNGVASYTEYDPANGWLFKRQVGKGGGTGLIDAQVSWDLNGGLVTLDFATLLGRRKKQGLQLRC